MQRNDFRLTRLYLELSFIVHLNQVATCHIQIQVVSSMKYADLKYQTHGYIYLKKPSGDGSKLKVGGG